VRGATMTEVLAGLFIVLWLLFFAAGSIGLLRLPDLYCRLHALTKADNVGLGLIVVGLLTLTEEPLVALKLIVVWLLVLASGATSTHLIALRARRKEPVQWKP